MASYEGVTAGDCVVYLDPGHGGEDFGTHAYPPIVESDWVWQFCRDLGRCRLPGVAFGLTREENEDPRFAIRAARAREGGANLVLSIHVNANKSPSLNGATCYVLPHDPIARRVGRTLLGALPHYMLPNARRDKTDPIIAYNDPRETDDDWLQAPINVLERHEGAHPILFEVGYASNARDRENLTEARGKLACMGAVLIGIAEFMRLKDA